MSRNVLTQKQKIVYLSLLQTRLTPALTAHILLTTWHFESNLSIVLLGGRQIQTLLSAEQKHPGRLFHLVPPVCYICSQQQLIQEMCVCLCACRRCVSYFQSLTLIGESLLRIPASSLVAAGDWSWSTACQKLLVITAQEGRRHLSTSFWHQILALLGIRKLL